LSTASSTCPSASGPRPGPTSRAALQSWSRTFHLVLVSGEGQVLLGRRQKHGVRRRARFHLPSGHLEPGESVVAALIREAKEETGITIAPEHAEFGATSCTTPPDAAGRHFFFLVRQWSGAPVNCEPDKCSELAWFALDQLPEPIVDYCRARADAHSGPGGSSRCTAGKSPRIGQLGQRAMFGAKLDKRGRDPDARRVDVVVGNVAARGPARPRQSWNDPGNWS